jgi:prolyl-tRNA synthetase
LLEEILKEKEVPCNKQDIANKVEHLLENIQNNLYPKSNSMRETSTYTKLIVTMNLNALLEETPGFVMAHWDGTSETEEKIKEETKATIRCIPLDNKQEAW